MKSVGRYDFRIVTDGKLFKPQRRHRFFPKRHWFSRAEDTFTKWEDMTNWGVPLAWAKEVIDEQVDIEERHEHGWVEVEV